MPEKSLQERLMKQVGEESIKYIPLDIEVVAFGAGRTVCKALDAFHKDSRFRGVSVVCGSEGTERYARELGLDVVSLKDLSEGTYIYIDGADQIDPYKNLLKGGFKNLGDPGLEGCMYREKQLAYRAREFIVIADNTKLVEFLGSGGYGLPVEFKRYEMERVLAFLRKTFPESESKVRLKPDSNYFVTENDNYIFDVPFDGQSRDLTKLEQTLNLDKGIFSTGLFAIKKPSKIIVATQGEIRVIE